MTTASATPLGATLAARIAATGPISLSEYMAECLFHPAHGYYATRSPIGAQGDFTTAPEVTQMFGELVGLALAQAWLDQGACGAFTLAELGPGRGTLMADLWRAVRAVPGFRDAARLYLVERSGPLRRAQADRLADARPSWIDAVDALPDDAPLYLVANEFLDALPIRQFTRDAHGWREHMVAVQDTGLGLALSPPAAIAALDHRLDDTAPGDVVEICPSLPAIIAGIATRIAARGGLAVIIDYGGWRSRADTFQAVRRHAPCDPFEAPGMADLTAHVDFEAVARAAEAAGARVWGPEAQGIWLGRLGLVERAQALAKALPDDVARRSHHAAFRRLTEASEMGTVFKAMAITRPDTPTPPGFPSRPPGPDGPA
jgi:SAM-dependent MidA family methyltransferase